MGKGGGESARLGEYRGGGGDFPNGVGVLPPTYRTRGSLGEGQKASGGKKRDSRGDEEGKSCQGKKVKKKRREPF